MNNQFISAIEQICEEKGVSKETVLETVQQALAAAYKKDYGHRDQMVRSEINPQTGEMRIFVTKEVAKEVENPYLQISVDDAQKIKKDAKTGSTVEIEEKNKDFGRVAAQTAKQVIIQRIREAEREVVFEEYHEKQGTILNGIVQRIEGNNVYVDLGKSVGIMFYQEQIPGERYYTGQRLKVYVVKVEQTPKGPQIVVSRSHPDMVKKLFEMEVPEIVSGTVEIVDIAREAGSRTKIAVKSNEENVDPVGTFVGGRGTRVQAVIASIAEEKIDIIPYNDDPKIFITSALSPTKVISVKIDEKEKKAVVKVPDDQLSLAIGKQGQNVRLAAKLTGWNVDIDGADESGIEEAAKAIETGKKKNKVNLEDALIEAANQQAQSSKPLEASKLKKVEEKNFKGKSKDTTVKQEGKSKEPETKKKDIQNKKEKQ
ncbi:MAG: transcription termination factor NusA [bacterium]|nr:transcription termination factor NusA [bacterium]